ncbi:hypothetical protein Tco_0043768 [Tanacetum coccineum]
MMASIDEDVEKSSLTDQDDVGSGVSARYASTSHAKRVTSSRSSISGDHRRSRRDSPEYDRREVRVVMIGIIETVQNRHLILEEATDI